VRLGSALSGFAPLVTALNASKESDLVGAARFRHHFGGGSVTVAVLGRTGLFHRLAGVLRRVGNGGYPTIPLSIFCRHRRFCVRVPRFLVPTGATHPHVALRVHQRATFVTELHISSGYAGVGYMC
jgi:hypothetical protein